MRRRDRLSDARIGIGAIPRVRTRAREDAWRPFCMSADVRIETTVTKIVYPPPRLGRSSRHSIAWNASVMAFAAFTGWLALATVNDVTRLTYALPPTPPEVVRDLVVRDAQDLSGRRATFRVLLFTDEFRWRLSSVEHVEQATRVPQFTPEMKAVLNGAEEIICVGASSEELPVGATLAEGRAREERRAARRADQIATWVRSALSEPVPVRKLNVGHHARTGGVPDTSDQRRVVIILVLDRDKGANVDEALRMAMARESERAPIFETLLSNYSLSADKAFTWVP